MKHRDPWNRHRIWTSAGAGLAALLAAQAARAEPTPADRAEADLLFEEARRLVQDSAQLDLACVRFEQSQHLLPRLGTLLNLALCHERQGRIATAWRELMVAAKLAREPNNAKKDLATGRAKLIDEHLASLAPSLTRLTLEPPSGAGGAEVTIAVDGVPVPSTQWGEPILLDPGEHEISAKAPGRRPFHATKHVGREGANLRIVIPALPPLSEPHPKEGSSTPAVGTDGRWIAGWTVGGLSMAALAAGTALGVTAIIKQRESEAACSAGCSQRGFDAYHQGRDAARGANATLGVALATGSLSTYLLVTSPRGPRSTTQSPTTTAVLPISHGAMFVMRRVF